MTTAATAALTHDASTALIPLEPSTIISSIPWYAEGGEDSLRDEEAAGAVDVDAIPCTIDTEVEVYSRGVEVFADHDSLSCVKVVNDDQVWIYIISPIRRHLDIMDCHMT